ncbi:MAG TPA: alpha/beta hydrolase [Candidatus Cybelea sp.]|jgi:pimeloyl-ACP methyl ester carboxylesterase|nr:alpha/beta hydrolase [Candidatus Cybelea sp.]
MQVFADDGARIDVRVDGSKDARALVLIHGFPLTRAIWDAQADALASGFYVLRPDLRGAGKSSAPEGPYLMERLAADIAALLDALGLERVAIAGHSMGGYVALAFARMFTERVSRLALVSSRLRADTADEAAARRAMADRVEREQSVKPAIETYLPHLLAPRTVAERGEVVERTREIAGTNSPSGVAATLRGMALRSPSEDIAEDLTAPMLLVTGGHDEVVGMEEARSIVATFPNGLLAVCEESGHLPMMEEPKPCTEALERWLNE